MNDDNVLAAFDGIVTALEKFAVLNKALESELLATQRAVDNLTLRLQVLEQQGGMTLGKLLQKYGEHRERPNDF